MKDGFAGRGSMTNKTPLDHYDDVRLYTHNLPVILVDRVDLYKGRFTTRTQIIVAALEHYLDHLEATGAPKRERPQTWACSNQAGRKPPR